MNLAKITKAANIVSLSLIIIVAIYSYGWYIYSPLSRPSIRDYREISDYLKKNFKKDSDVIILQPFWAERAREYIGDLNILNPREPLKEDFSIYSNIYVFSVFGYGENIKEGLSKRFRFSEKREFGKLSLYHYINEKPDKLIYDFYKNIKDAQVSVIKGKETKECRDFKDDIWRCGGPEWQYIGKEILDIDGTGRECIWAHPVTGSIIEITFDKVVLGDRISGFTGLTDEAVRYREGSPVFLAVLIDDKEMLYHTNPNRIGTHRFTINTGDFKNTPHKITFRVSTHLDGVRHFCFYADTRESR